MHDLVRLEQIPPGALTMAEIDATRAFAENEKAPVTREAHEIDWRQFAVWNRSPGIVASPCRAGAPTAQR